VVAGDRVICVGCGRGAEWLSARWPSSRARAFATALAAGLPGLAPKLLPPEQAFRFSARVLDPATLEARFDVADGYYLYRDKLRFTAEPVAGSLPATCRAAAQARRVLRRCRDLSRRGDVFACRS
jgi:thiol:disulfide interchange protein